MMFADEVTPVARAVVRCAGFGRLRAVRSRANGFTLIELMITVAVLGILVAVAYPSYSDYVYDGRRTDGQAALMDAAQRLERCYSNAMSYDDGACANVETDIDGANSSDEHYTLASSNMSATTYTLTATPQGVQSDDECGDLTLDHTGERDVANADSGVTADDCW